MFRPPSCGTFGSGGIVLMSRGTNVFGSSCAKRTRYSTPPACSNAIWIASRIDWFTLFGVPFARPPQRVPLGGLGGTAGPGETGAVREPTEEGAAEPKSGRHWTVDVIPLLHHYFSQKASQRLERIRSLSRFNRLFSTGADGPDALCGGMGHRGVEKLANQLSDGLPRQLSVSKQGAMKFMRPLIDAGLIVKDGTAKTESAPERIQK
jgi:hypothetical protein